MQEPQPFPTPQRCLKTELKIRSGTSWAFFSRTIFSPVRSTRSYIQTPFRFCPSTERREEDRLAFTCSILSYTLLQVKTARVVDEQQTLVHRTSKRNRR